MNLLARIEKLERASSGAAAYVWFEPGESETAALARWHRDNPGQDADRVVYIRWLNEAEAV